MKEFLFVIKTLSKQVISFIIPIAIMIIIGLVAKHFITADVANIFRAIGISLVTLMIVICVYVSIRDKVNSIREEYAWRVRNGHIK